MKRNTQNLACVAFALLGELASPGLLSSQEKAQLRQYDVVPPVWITPDGVMDHRGEIDGSGQARAFVFPSLAPEEIAPGTGPIKLKNFLQSNNRLKSSAFEWAPERGITLTLSRVGADVTVEIDNNSMSRIRHLDWDRFRQLQGAFKDWLLHRSGCTIFTDGESRFTELPRHLIAMWKAVLRHSTFDRFSTEYLNLAGPFPVEYSRTSDSFSISKEQTRMYGIEIEPRQVLAITWGGENVYPADTLVTSYSRSTSTGSSRVQIVSELGMRLYRAAACGAASVGQIEKAVTDDTKLVPYPYAMRGLLGTEFIPIYNLFDLHNSILLQKQGFAQPPDCLAHEHRAPEHLFLLIPTHYVKADEGLQGPASIAQFENEARPGFRAAISPGDQVNLLARQFVIMGCDSASDVKQEWSRFLEVAYAALAGSKDAPTTTTSCSNYVRGVFSGKSFVEIRNHFSINGHPVEEGALPSESIGNAVGAMLGAHLNLEGHPGSGPLVELRRSPPVGKNRLRARAIQIRFHTTMTGVLDQAGLLEGDEIYGGSISEILR